MKTFNHDDTAVVTSGPHKGVRGWIRKVKDHPDHYKLVGHDAYPTRAGIQHVSNLESCKNPETQINERINFTALHSVKHPNATGNTYNDHFNAHGKNAWKIASAVRKERDENMKTHGYKAGMLHDHVLKAYSSWKSKQVDEEVELDEVLNIQQRQKRAQIIKRYKSKIQRARELAQRKMAPAKNIQKRAYAQARKLVRTRVAGKRGAEYETLGPSEKMAIDKALDSKKGLIKKIAMRLVPRVKQAETKRLHSFMKGSALKSQAPAEGKANGGLHEDIDTFFSEAFPNSYATNDAYGSSKSKRVSPGSDDDMGKKSTPEKKDAKNTEDKKGAQQLKNGGHYAPGNKNIIQYSKFEEAVALDSKAFHSLVNKSEASGIELEILGEIYDRGCDAWKENFNVSQQQYAFARVNSFINKGNTYFNEDSDLQELSKDTLKSYSQKAAPLADKYASKYNTMRANKDKRDGRFTDDTPHMAKYGRKANNKEDGLWRASPYYQASKKTTNEELDEIFGDEAADLITKARKKFPDGNHAVHGHINDLISAIGQGRGNANKSAAAIQQHLEESNYRMREPHPLLKAANANLIKLAADKAAGRAPMRDKKPPTWASYERETRKEDIKHYKDTADHHLEKYNHHHAQVKEHDEMMDEVRNNPKNHGFRDAHHADQGLEEIDHMREKHAEARYKHETAHLNARHEYETLSGKNYKKKLSEEVEDLDELAAISPPNEASRKWNDHVTNLRMKMAADRAKARGKKSLAMAEEVVNEVRKPSTTYVKPHFGSSDGTTQTGWKASNKHGKVKYFGLPFKASAAKHANGPVIVEENDDGWYSHREIYGKVSKEHWKKGWRYNHLKPKKFYNSNSKTWHASITEEHTKCGTPECCGQCDTPINTAFDEAFRKAKDPWSPDVPAPANAYHPITGKINKASKAYKDHVREHYPKTLWKQHGVTEEVRSADTKGVIVRRADGSAYVRKQKVNRKIIGSGNITDGKPDGIGDTST